MFFGIIVYGVGHGLILMPVVLSLFGAVRPPLGGSIKVVDATTEATVEGTAATQPKVEGA